MERQPVKSSNIRSVGYDPATRTLEIEFSAGGVYHYVNLAPVVHAALMKAPSKGTYLEARVKNRYRRKKVS